jgi:hypothetical protein
MKSFFSSWKGIAEGLGRAFVDVLHAEVAALQSDLRGSAAQLAKGLAILGVAAIFLIWVIGIVCLALAVFLDRYMDLWIAVLLVGGLLAATAAALLLWAKSTLEGIRAPAELVRTRVDDHKAWLAGQLEPDDEPRSQEVSE